MARKAPARNTQPVATQFPFPSAEQALALMARQIVPGGEADPKKALLSGVLSLWAAKTCYLAEFDPSEGRLEVTSVRGRNDSRIQASVPGQDPVGRAFELQRIVCEGAWLAAPLFGSRGVWGCLVILGAKRQHSDFVLSAAAGQIAAALEFLHLQDDSARRNKDLQTALSGLKAMEKNREDLLSDVSHDLKNPLTTVQTYLALLRTGKLGPLTPEQLKALDSCTRNSDRLLQMIRDLLLISRLQSGKMELQERPFGLKAIAEDVFQSLLPMAEQAKVRLHFKKSPEVFLRGDRDRIREATAKIVENAIQHSHAHGEVELSVLPNHSGFAVLRVKDHGIGMAPEQMAHLFDAYARRRSGAPARQATGLGLSIASKIVHLHGGRIEAESARGTGSTFDIYLPIFAGAVQPISWKAQRRAGGVLLVEDDADCREVMQQLLEQEGYRVIAAHSAADAKALLRDLRPGIVLLDLRLSDEDGRSVLHFIRETPVLANLPVYLISGATEVASLATGKGRDRVEGVFEKPLSLPKLLDTIAAVVRPTRKQQAT